MKARFDFISIPLSAQPSSLSGVKRSRREQMSLGKSMRFEFTSSSSARNQAL
jgi:hypothetical protein